MGYPWPISSARARSAAGLAVSPTPTIQLTTRTSNYALPTCNIWYGIPFRPPVPHFFRTSFCLMQKNILAVLAEHTELVTGKQTAHGNMVLKTGHHHF